MSAAPTPTCPPTSCSSWAPAASADRAFGGIAEGRGVEDSPHTPTFRDIAEEVGLEVSRDDAGEWRCTRLSTAARRRYATAIERLDRLLDLYRDP